MSDTEPNQDCFEGGIATLSADPSEEFDGNNPWKVSGVAIPVNTVLKGGQKVEHFYDAETLQDAGEMLEGASIVKNFHDIDGQATADDVIGEVTNAGFQKGVGLVFDGEIADADIAEKVDNGYLDVSPSPMRSLGEYEETMGAQRVNQLVGFRDLAVVAQGQPGAKIEMGGNPAVEALSLDALSNGFDVLSGDEPAESGADAAEDPEHDDGANGDSPQSSAASTPTETMSDTETDLTEEEQAVLRAAGDVENATDVLGAYADAENPEIVEQDALEAKDEQIDEFADVFRDALQSRTDLKEGTVKAMPVDALASEFRTEDGEIDVETLSQSPETQTTTIDDEPDEPSIDSLSGEDKQAIKNKLKRAKMFEGRTPEHVDTLRNEAAELAGVEDADEIEVDAL